MVGEVVALLGGGAYLAFIAYRMLSVAGPGLLSPLGRPVGSDFVQYWATSALALAGEPAAAYDPARLLSAERAAIAADTIVVPWHYPPSFMLVVLPLSLMPYLVALALWLAIPLAAYAMVLRRVATGTLVLALGLLFPAVTHSLGSGQNGLISAALLGGGLLLIERRPLMGGALLGLLSYKPQLAVLIPVALIAGGHWRALLGAALAALGLAAASALVLGLEPWLAFASDLAGGAQATPARERTWSRMPTIFITARMAGAEPALAFAFQAVGSLAAAWAVAWAWRARLDLPLRGAVLACAIPVFTPYAFDYDLALLALAFAWLAQDAARAEGWRAPERLILAAAWFTPAAWVFSEWGGQQPGAVVLLLLLAVVVRRARRESLRSRQRT
jgi:hypothetical protein